jgi:hypothetical protein
MNQRRPPSRVHSHTRTAARLRRRRRGTTTPSAEVRIRRALARRAADQRAVPDLTPLLWPSELELFERIFGFQP